MAVPEGYLEMGSLGRARGLKGEIAFVWHGTRRPEPGADVWVCREGTEPDKRKIEAVASHGDRQYLRLSGVSDRTKAEKFNGAPLAIPRAALSPPDEDEAYTGDLIGCLVYLTDGELIGRLDHVEFPAGREVWAIKPDDGAEILFPAAPEFVESLDPDNRRVVIAPPPGLLEIYRA